MRGPASDKPSGTGTPAPTEREVESSLRHISVRYHRVFGYADPTPLLTESQVSAYAPILAREFPTLKPGERVLIRFTDPHFGFGHVDEMEVWPEDRAIVYWFSALAVADPPPEGMEGAFLGELAESMPGQEVVNRENSAYLKDPLSGAARDAAVALATEKQMLRSAQDDQVVPSEEVSRLESLIAGQRPSLQAWKTYWEKRRALKKALDLNLMDQDSYQTQLSRLYAELER